MTEALTQRAYQELHGARRQPLLEKLLHAHVLAAVEREQQHAPALGRQLLHLVPSARVVPLAAAVLLRAEVQIAGARADRQTEPRRALRRLQLEALRHQPQRAFADPVLEPPLRRRLSLSCRCRHGLRLAHEVQRLLGRGLEGAHGSQPVLVEDDAHGLERLQAVEVHHRAAGRELPGAFHEVHALVARAHQPLDDLLTRDGGAHREAHGLVRVIARKRQRSAQRLRRADDAGRALLEQFQGRHARPLVVAEHRRRSARPGHQRQERGIRVGGVLGFLLVLGDEDDRPLERRRRDARRQTLPRHERPRQVRPRSRARNSGDAH